MNQFSRLKEAKSCLHHDPLSSLAPSASFNPFKSIFIKRKYFTRPVHGSYTSHPTPSRSVNTNHHFFVFNSRFSIHRVSASLLTIEFVFYALFMAIFLVYGFMWQVRFLRLLWKVFLVVCMVRLFCYCMKILQKVSLQDLIFLSSPTFLTPSENYFFRGADNKMSSLFDDGSAHICPFQHANATGYFQNFGSNTENRFFF